MMEFNNFEASHDALQMKYQIYGDYGLDSQNLLEEFKFIETARGWFKKYTLRDIGGYSNISLVTASGEVLNCVEELML